jgi:hypothetical protein
MKYTLSAGLIPQHFQTNFILQNNHNHEQVSIVTRYTPVPPADLLYEIGWSGTGRRKQRNKTAF